MSYTGYEIAILFFVYSFLGWIGETIAVTVKGKSFANRGFASGPFCFIYGFSGALFALAFEELAGQPVFLFIGCMTTATIIEWSAARLLERLHQQRWWDYSHKKLNFDGYICLQYSLLWGVLGTCSVLYGNGFLVRLFHLLPPLLGKSIVWILVSIAFVDGLLSVLTLLHLEEKAKNLEHWSLRLKSLTLRFGCWLSSHVERRIERAYPDIKAVQTASASSMNQPLSFLKLMWLFTLASLVGDIVETLFCRFTAGIWMSRSSLVWGPFSVVWGGALVIATILLHRDRNKPDSIIFLIGTLMGGAYEYICSVISERVFGAVFWDYSKIPFNLGGRINLLYCFFWGIAAVLWIKGVYPYFSAVIDMILKRTKKFVSWVLVLFMTANVLVSVGALARYTARAAGISASSPAAQFLDEHFEDERMEKLYPNIILR